MRGEYIIGFARVSWALEPLIDKVVASFVCPVCSERKEFEWPGVLPSDAAQQITFVIRNHFTLLHGKQSPLPLRLGDPSPSEEFDRGGPGMPPLRHPSADCKRVTVHKRLDDHKLVYFEAWMDAQYLVQHYGKINTRGQIPLRRWFDDIAAGQEQIRQLFAERLENGYAEIPIQQVHTISLEYLLSGRIASNSPPSRLLDIIREDLCWSGLWCSQRVDSLEEGFAIRFDVVDAEMAIERISDLLGGTEFGAFASLRETTSGFFN